MKTRLTTILWLTVFSVIPFGWPQRTVADDATNVLATLQKNLSGTTNVVANFVQEKQMSVMRQKVIIKGRLAFQQPNLFAWHVTEPIRYNLVLQGSTLRQWDETTGKVQEMSMANNPVFEMVNRQLRAWFGGEFEALMKDFDARISPSSTRSVIFTPKQDSFARKAIRHVVLTFREDGRYLESIRIEELSGDTTLMTFINTVINSSIPPEVWEVKPHGR